MTDNSKLLMSAQRDPVCCEGERQVVEYSPERHTERISQQAMTGAPDKAQECFFTRRGLFREEKTHRGGTANYLPSVL